MSDAEFVAQLRMVTQHYLETIDAWEAEYHKFYRLCAPNRVSSDIEPFQQNYLRARREILRLAPRARQLCLKYQLRDPWQAILHIQLGASTPQTGAVTAIGQGERSAVVQCLAAMDAAIMAPALEPAPPPVPSGILQRLWQYFT